MQMYVLSDILKLAEVTPRKGKPEWANIKSRKLPGRPQDLAGGGVYACFWKNKLIYVGKFVHKDGEPLGGHVYDRIGKHAAGFLQRDHRLFFYPAPFDAVLSMEGEIAVGLRLADRNAMVDTGEPGQTGGKGVCSTKNKVRWAQGDWDFIKSASPSDIVEHFTFGYRRVAPPAGTNTRSKEFVDKWVGNIEKNIIYDLNPPCNKQYMDYKETVSDIQSITEIFDSHFMNIKNLP